jgi:hypothetical protein
LLLPRRRRVFAVASLAIFFGRGAVAIAPLAIGARAVAITLNVWALYVRALLAARTAAIIRSEVGGALVASLAARDHSPHVGHFTAELGNFLL